MHDKKFLKFKMHKYLGLFTEITVHIDYTGHSKSVVGKSASQQDNLKNNQYMY